MKSGNALFICNKKYLDPLAPAGGVKLCTQEFIDLIKTKFETVLFPVQLKSSLLYRAKKKMGLSAYEDYNVTKYESLLKKIITENNIRFVFLNLTNTFIFSGQIKRIFPGIKIILCSHGNESGDFLHEIVLLKKQNGIKKITSRYVLGKMLAAESALRKNIDVVLTVSEIEFNIEKWLGTENVYLVYRTIKVDTTDHCPLKGRIGFFSDLSHAPNYYGITKVCEALIKLNTGNIELRLVSAAIKAGKELAEKFPFIKYLGYLTEDQLIKEAATWTFCLNPVFYYSRGVSTKMGKAFGIGVPVITTEKGMRGYQWKSGEILCCKTPGEMAALIIKHANNIEDSVFYRNEIAKMQASSPGLQDMMNDICDLIEKTS